MMMTPSILLVAAVIAPEAASFEFETNTDVVYSTVGDQELLLDVDVPTSGKNRPAVLVVHGGARKMGNRKQLKGYATALAEKGFVCFAIDYRLAPQHQFPAQIDDCRSAVKWIREHADEYKIDPSRLGAIGYSAGGHLVSLLGTTGEAPSADNGNVDTRIQAVAAGGAPTDFRQFPDNGEWAEYLMGGNLSEVPEKFEQASPAAFVDATDAPTYFYNGTQDELVPLVWSMACHQALKAAGVRTRMHMVTGANHLQAAADAEALQQAYQFLQKELAPGGASEQEL